MLLQCCCFCSMVLRMLPQQAAAAAELLPQSAAAASCSCCHSMLPQHAAAATCCCCCSMLLLCALLLLLVIIRPKPRSFWSGYHSSVMFLTPHRHEARVQVVPPTPRNPAPPGKLGEQSSQELTAPPFDRGVDSLAQYQQPNLCIVSQCV